MHHLLEHISFYEDKQADIGVYSTTATTLDGIFNIDIIYIDNTVSQIYHLELELNIIPITSDTKVSFLDVHSSASNSIVSIKMYDKIDKVEFEIVNFPYLGGDIPRSTSYGIYISHPIC